MLRRYRQQSSGHIAEVWVDIGWLGYTVELYENGRFVDRKRKRIRPRSGIEEHLVGECTAVLIHFDRQSGVRCTWAR